MLDGSTAHALSDAFCNKAAKVRKSQIFRFITLLLAPASIVLINALNFMRMLSPADSATSAVKESAVTALSPVYSCEPSCVEPCVDTIAVIREDKMRCL